MAPPKRPFAELGRPARGLPRYYMDCGWYRHPNFAGLPLEALFLHEAGVGYCTQHGTDGHLPAHPEDLAIAIGLRATIVRKGLRALLEAGRWTATGDGRVQIASYLGHNPSSSEVEDYSESRRRRGLAGNHRRWHIERNRPDPACPLCVEAGLVPAIDPAINENDSHHDRIEFGSSSDRKAHVGMSENPIRPQGGGSQNRSQNTPPDQPKPGSQDSQAAIADGSQNESHGMGWDGIPLCPPSHNEAAPPRRPADAGEEEPTWNHDPTALEAAVWDNIRACELHHADPRQPDAWWRTTEPGLRERWTQPIRDAINGITSLSRYPLHVAAANLTERLDPDRWGHLDGGTARSDIDRRHQDRADAIERAWTRALDTEHAAIDQLVAAHPDQHQQLTAAEVDRLTANGLNQRLAERLAPRTASVELAKAHGLQLLPSRTDWPEGTPPPTIEYPPQEPPPRLVGPSVGDAGDEPSVLHPHGPGGGGATVSGDAPGPDRPPEDPARGLGDLGGDAA